MKFVIKPATSEAWADMPISQRPHYITEVADNGEIISVSEMYADRHNAYRAAHRRGVKYTITPEIEFEQENEQA